MKRRLPALAATVGGTILLVLTFYLIGLQRVIFQLEQVGLAGASIFIINVLLILLIDAASWQIILKSYGQCIPFRDILATKIIGFVVSYLTPSMYFGGEPVRAYLISKKHDLSITKVGASVVVNRFLELGAGLFFIYLGSIWTLVEYELPLQLSVVMVVVNVLMGLGMAALLISFIYENRLFTNLANFLSRWNPLSKAVEKVKPHISKMEGEVFLVFRKHRRETLVAFALNFLAGSLIFLKPAIFFYFLGIIFKLSQLSLLFALTHLILILQVTPGALGVFELGEVAIYGLVGVEAQKALAFSLMVRITDAVVIAIALFLALHFGLNRLWGRKQE
jgi:uncharacterized protein (TIRG00374 family)